MTGDEVLLISNSMEFFLLEKLILAQFINMLRAFYGT
jgi:hypothetical protein